MATPYDSAGGLLGLDPQELAKLIAQVRPLMEQFQPNEADRRDANTQAIITAGLSLLGARKGQEWDRLGYAGLNALDAKNATLQNAYRMRMEGMQGAGAAMDLLTKAQGMADTAKERRVLTNFYKNQGMPSAGGAPAPVPGAVPPSALFDPASIDLAGGGPPESAMLPAAAPASPVSTMLTGLDALNAMPAKQRAAVAADIQRNPNQPISAITYDPRPIGADASPSVPPPNMPPPVIARPSAIAPTKISKFEAYNALSEQMMGVGLPAQAQVWADRAEKFRPQLESQKVYTVNGERTLFNVYKDGTMQIAQPGVGPDQEKLHFSDEGNAIQPRDNLTGKAIGPPIPKQTTPDAQQSNALAREHLEETKRHNQMVEGDPAVIEQTAQGIANGTLQPLSGFALARPMGQAVMARVTQINPAFDPTDFSTKQKAEKDFATGKQGNTVRSFNVALTHLDTLGQLADALHNGNAQLVNKIGNIVSQQTGSPAVTNFNAAKTIVANEIVKAIVGSGGGVEDRDKAQKVVNDANSPAQLKGVIDTYKQLMAGQLHGLRLQYEAATKKNDFDRFLTPQAKTQLMGATPGGGATGEWSATRVQ